MTQNYAYWADGYTGGGEGTLDKISATRLNNLDMAIIVSSTGSEVNIYWLDDDSGAAESSPTIIQPDDDTTGKRWIQIFAADQDLTTDSTGVVFADMVITGTQNVETHLVVGATGGATANEVVKIVGASDRHFFVDTSNPDHFKKNQNLIFSADPGDTHASTIINILLDGSNVFEIDSNFHVKIPNNLIVGSTGTANEAMEIVGDLRLDGNSYSIIGNSTAASREVLYVRAKSSATDGSQISLFGNADTGGVAGGIRIFTNATNAFEIDNSQNAKFPTALMIGSTGNPSEKLDVYGNIALLNSGTLNSSAGNLTIAGNTRVDQDVSDTGTPTFKTLNALTLTAVATGFTIAGGTTPKTLTADDDFVVSTQLAAIAANTAKVTESTTVTSPLVLTTYDISIPAATSGANGYMTSTYAGKLDGIEASADVTDFANVQAALAAASGAVDFNTQNLTGLGTVASAAGTLTLDETASLSDYTANADTDVSGNGWVIDEDNMVSNLATKVPTQQSVKAYVDASSPSALEDIGDVVAYDSLADDEILQWNTAAGGWRHRTLAEAGLELAAHKDNHDPEDGSDPLDCAAAGEIVGVVAAAEGTAHSFARSDHTHQIQHSIADNHIVTIDGTANQNEHAVFGVGGIAGLTDTELLAALSGDAGAAFDFNSQNLTSIGTIGCGTITTTGNIIMPDGGTIGQAAGPLLAFDDTNNYLEITGCSVGLGIGVPLAKVHIYQTSGRYGLYLSGTPTAASGIVAGIYPEQTLTASANNDNLYGIRISSVASVGAYTGTTYSSLAIDTPTGAANNFAINVAGGICYFGGNVGIGTTSPYYKLEVNAGTDDLVAAFVSSDANAGITFKDDSTTAYGSVGLRAVGDDLHLFSGPNGVEGTLYMDSSGNVGIGTTSPQKLMELSANNDSAGENNTLRFTDKDTTAAADQVLGKIEFYSSDASGAGVKAYISGHAESTTPDGYLSLGTNATEAIRVTSAQRVGFGISTPDGRVHVWNGSAGTVSAYSSADELIIENSDHGGLSILVPDNKESIVAFGSASNNWTAGIVASYNSGSPYFRILMTATPIIAIDANANWGLRTVSFGANMYGGIQMANATAPTGNVADTFAFYAYDQVAGNSCPHFRTEEGDVIKIYQADKADYNNWASYTDIVDALVAMGLFDAA